MNRQQAIRRISVFLLLAFIGFVIADLLLLSQRDRLFPLEPPPPRAPQFHQAQRTDRSAYQVIASRNIFNADQKIGEPFGTAKKNKPDAPPVLTSLPIQLIGTIVHIDGRRSVATLLLKSKNEQATVRVDLPIGDNLGVVTKIERSRVTFRNTALQRLEYVEMADDMKISFGTSNKPVQVGEVVHNSDTDFELKRDDVEKLTSNLPELLQQARAVPRLGANGQIECFSLADIAPNSIYERLGLKRGDCIKSVNGETIDSPAKAMDLYNALRAKADSVNLGIERGGKDQSMNYNIR